MAKWNGNIISKDARYRTQTSGLARGIYSLDEHIQHKNAGNWPEPINNTIGDNEGYHLPILTINENTVAGDNADNYNVVTAALPSDASQGRVYIAMRVTATTTYYNDFVIGAVQIPHADGASLNTTSDTSTNVNWNMNNTTYGSASWERGSASTAGNNTLSSISGYTWTAIGSGSTVRRWNRATSTSSQRTGAAGGINIAADYNIFNELGDLGPFGDSAARIPQTGANYYIYVETSGIGLGEIVWARSPEVTLTGSNHILVLCYHAYTSSGGIGMVNTEAKPLIKVFWDES
jgi:hypothetical protein